MNIKPILLRLQNALGQDNLSEQMLLSPGSSPSSEITGNFVIGYNGSPNSQTALDFILWMAHQTRLATQKQVMVHVVYVIDCYNSLNLPSLPRSQSAQSSNTCALPAVEQFGFQCSTRTLAQSGSRVQVMERQAPPASFVDTLEDVDRILWQARCLSDEWRGSVEAHLRFGAVATELQQVVAAQSADLLFLGCTDAEHPLLQQLANCISCPILGIPTELEAI